MRRAPLLMACVAVLALSASPSRAASPLRLIPAEADFVVQVQDSKRLVERITNLDVLQQLYALPAVREQLEATPARRLKQLIAYYEKTLGDKWPSLVQRLTAGGAALGLKFASGNPPVVLVLQGNDAKLLEQFVQTSMEILQSELERQESKEKLTRGDYHGIPGFRVGELWVARAEATLILSNKKDAMARALDLHLGRGEQKSILEQPALAEAKKLLPKDSLVNAWLNMEPVQQSPGAKELYKSPRDDGIITVLFGRHFDILGRTPFLCAALTANDHEYRLTLRAPRGRDGMGADRLLHVPPPGQPASRALLVPKGTIYSTAFYLDVANIWKEREQLFPKVQADNLTEFDKTSGRFLGGVKLSALLQSAGPYHRFVVVHQGKSPYQRQPQLPLPAFAFVSEVREPEKFGRSMETLLRAAAIAATSTFKMELHELKYRDFDLVSYRFNEKADLAEDSSDLRFNFTPCFARVGDQFLLASTVELAKQLIDRLLDHPADSKQPSHLVGRDRFQSGGVADYLGGLRDQLVTQTVLELAVPAAEAQQQVEQLLKFVRGLGTLETQVEFRDKTYRVDVLLRLGQR